MKQLIIADDEAYMRNHLHQLFPWTRMGIRVVALVSNGQEVLDYLEQHPADLILADIRMPVMDGLTLAQICWERKLPVTIVLLSAHAEFEYARSAMRYGVSAYLTKPVKYEELAAVFSKAAGSMPLSPALAPDRSLPEEGTTGPTREYKGYYQEIVQLIQTYINSNLDTATLIGAAELTGLSASYVSTIFHRCLAQTFSDYLTGARMKKAAELLAGGTSIADTAWQIGYDNPKNFVRRFRQYFGFDPAGPGPDNTR